MLGDLTNKADKPIRPKPRALVRGDVIRDKDGTTIVISETRVYTYFELKALFALAKP